MILKVSSNWNNSMILWQSRPQHQGAAPAREPHESCPRAVISWHCCLCVTAASSVCPLHFFCQDVESTKICLSSSHLLPLQFPFLPFTYPPNPAFPYCSVSKSSAGARLCTTSFLWSSGSEELRKLKNLEVIMFNWRSQVPKQNIRNTQKNALTATKRQGQIF